MAAQSWGTHNEHHLSPNSSNHPWSPSITDDDTATDGKSFRSWTDPANNPSWAEQAYLNQMERDKQLEMAAAAAAAAAATATATAGAPLFQSPGEPFRIDETHEDNYSSGQDFSTSSGSKRARIEDDWSEAELLPVGESVSGFESAAEPFQFKLQTNIPPPLANEPSFDDLEEDSREDEYTNDEYQYGKKLPPQHLGEPWLIPPLADADEATRVDDVDEDGETVAVSNQDPRKKFKPKSSETDSYDDLVIIEDEQSSPEICVESLVPEPYPTDYPRRRRDRSLIFRRIIMATICVAVVAIIVAISIAAVSGGSASAEINDEGRTSGTTNAGLAPPPGSDVANSQTMANAPMPSPTFSPVPSASPSVSSSPTLSPSSAPTLKPTPPPNAVSVSARFSFNLLYLPSKMDDETKQTFEEFLQFFPAPLLKSETPSIYGLEASILEQSFVPFGRRLPDDKATTSSFKDFRSLLEETPQTRYGTLSANVTISGHFNPDSNFQNAADLNFSRLFLESFTASKEDLIDALQWTGEYYVAFGIIDAIANDNVFANGSL